MSASFCLVLDVGNTRAKFALIDISQASSSSQLPRCHAVFSLPNAAHFDAGVVEQSLKTSAASLQYAIVSASNQTRLDELLKQWPAQWPAPRRIRSASELPIVLNIKSPEKVGVDRVLNAVAVNCVRELGQAGIIVDAGTAITIDVVSSHGEFLGGAIRPGFELEAHALHDYTHKLPLITLPEILGSPPDPIGKDTQAALRSGLVWGHIGAVNEVVRQITSVLRNAGNEDLTYFLTGGSAPLLRAEFPFPVSHTPELTLQGLGCLIEQH